MASHPNRNAIELSGPHAHAPIWRPDQPGQATWCMMRWTPACDRMARTAPQWEPLALYRFGGVLARHRQTGVFAEVFDTHFASCNQHKAEAALLALRGGA